MDFDGYRKAHLITLHSAGVVVHPESYPDHLVGWREFVENGETYTVETAALQAAGILPDDAPDDKSITVTKVLAEIGGGYGPTTDEGGLRIASLYARQEEEHLLSIKVVLPGENGSDTDPVTLEITYSGFYTVWWADNLGRGDRP